MAYDIAKRRNSSAGSRQGELDVDTGSVREESPPSPQPRRGAPEADATNGASATGACRIYRRILHIDMDAFFAAVEVLRRPELEGDPVIVGGRGNPSRRGVVSTASYEARRFGVHSAMPLRTAYQRCPHGVFLPVDMPLYVAWSRRIKTILREFSPVVEDTSIDEAFLDLTGITDSPEAIARSLKKRIWEQTGLACSAGVAPNKLLAKIASDLEKPDGLVILGPQDLQTRIMPLAVRKLWGVGPKTGQKLNAVGIRTIGDLAAVPQTRLIDWFGGSQGRYLARAAHGIDERPLVTQRQQKSISRETTFEHDVSQPERLAATLEELVRSVTDKLSRHQLETRHVTVKLRYADFETRSHGTTLDDPTDRTPAIRDAALRCLQRFELRRSVRLIGVRAGELRVRPAHQQNS
ncbi:MAG: DNA polymerase IV [Pseudomonadota bacterium]|nr:DNA polymerase IV [Pseudomonadota bacterium]